MIIVCLVLVIAAFVVMGTALALAELTLVNIALGLGGLAAVLLAVEFVRNRKALFGPGRAESLPDHRSAGLPGAVTGPVRTDDVGKASVPPLGTAAATGQVAAPTTSVGSPPVTVQDDGDRTAVVGISVPAPVSEPVREASIPPPAEARDATLSEPPQEEQHESAESSSGSSADDTPTAAASQEDADDAVEAVPASEPEDRAAGTAEDTDPVDTDDPVDENPPVETVAEPPCSDSDSDDSAAEHSPDMEATQELPVLADQLHGATAVDTDGPAADSEETPDSAAEELTVDSERDAEADDGESEDTASVDAATAEPDSETADSDEESEAADSGSADTAESDPSGDDGAAPGSADHDDSPADPADDTDPDVDETAVITFREPAEWNPPFALPSQEQYENKSVSAAAIAELAARWTPTGSDLGTEAAAAETEPDQTGSDTSTDSEDGSDPADPPRSSTTAAADDATS